LDKGAIISDCGKFRYRLWRRWDKGAASMAFVMLNPSTADADQDDPTIRKCIGFAERQACGGIDVVNLYAYRATKPADLKRAGYPRGPENDRFIAAAARESGRVVCAWGVNARSLSRPAEVLALLRGCGVRPLVLATSADGVPLHPLMLPYSMRPTPLDPFPVKGLEP
jgi:hypothetical protein